MRSKKGAKNVPAKTKVENIRQLKHSDNGVGVAKFSLNFDFGNFENETPNERVKKMSEEELDKIIEDQKSINTGRSTQFALRTWQSWLEQNEFAEAEKKPKSWEQKLCKSFFCPCLSVSVDSYSPCGPLDITPSACRFYYRNAKFCSEFWYGKYLIVPFWYAPTV